MKRRFWKFALLLVAPLALYGYIAERNSWRPKTIAFASIDVSQILFSADGRYMAITQLLAPTRNPARPARLAVVLFDREAQRNIKTIEDSIAWFVVGGDKVVTKSWAYKATKSYTRVYDMREGTLLGQSPLYFQAIGALPNGTTILGYVKPKSRSKNNILAWNHSVSSSLLLAKKRQATTIRQFATLPPQPYPSIRDVRYLADLQTLFIRDESGNGNNLTQTTITKSHLKKP